MRRIGGLILALQMAAGLLLPLSAFAMSRGTPTMACCMIHGRCDCSHSDASLARCNGQDVAPVFAAPTAPLPTASGRLAAITPGARLASESNDFSGLFD